MMRGGAWSGAGHGAVGTWGGGCMDHFRASHQAETSMIWQALRQPPMVEGAGAIGDMRARARR